MGGTPRSTAVRPSGDDGVRRYLHELSAHALLTGADEVELGRAIAAGIPGARYVEFEDASHAVTVQHADRVNALLLDHLDAARASVG